MSSDLTPAAEVPFCFRNGPERAAWISISDEAPLLAPPSEQANVAPRPVCVSIIFAPVVCGPSGQFQMPLWAGSVKNREPGAASIEPSPKTAPALELLIVGEAFATYPGWTR